MLLDSTANNKKDREAEEMNNTEAQNKYLSQDDTTLRRLQFMIDVVFAIGLLSFGLALLPQLLIEVDTTAGDSLLKEIQEEGRYFIQIALTYSITIMYWYKHTQQFKYLRRLNTGQVVLQFVYLFGILYLPLTLRFTVVFPEDSLSYVLHNLNLIWFGVFSILAWNQATTRNQLVDKDLPPELVRAIRREALLEPTVMALGIICALIGPVWWMLSFLLLLIIPMVENALKKNKKKKRSV